MKGDVSVSCWSCLSDMFSLIPSPRVVPRWPAFKKQPPESTRKPEPGTAAEPRACENTALTGSNQSRAGMNYPANKAMKIMNNVEICCVQATGGEGFFLTNRRKQADKNKINHAG